jgi:hypothetical protein
MRGWGNLGLHGAQLSVDLHQHTGYMRGPVQHQLCMAGPQHDCQSQGSSNMGALATDAPYANISWVH